MDSLPGDGFIAGMASLLEWRGKVQSYWRRKVQSLLQLAVDEILPGNGWCVPVPKQFGSVAYGLSTLTSDVDLCILGPVDVIVARGDDLRALLARGLIDNGIPPWKVSDQRAPRTLKWSCEERGHFFDMSLLLSDKASARGALGITSFLRSFYEERQSYRGVVQAVVARLRDAGALNKHGYGHSVGQAMKTASTALLCASLKVTAPSLSTETDVLRALAAFDSTRWVVIFG